MGVQRLHAKAIWSLPFKDETCDTDFLMLQNVSGTVGSANVFVDLELDTEFWEKIICDNNLNLGYGV